jgi:sialate O-acetylesterase
MGIEVFALSDAGDNPDEPVRLARVFADHMVLQRKQPIKVWGRAPAATGLTVTLAGESKTIHANADGNWEVDFAALPAGGPHSLSLHDEDELVQFVSDILIGDVWLCSGQSNMEVPVGEVNQGQAQPAKTPGTIRLMTVAHDSRVTPLSDFANSPGWSVADVQSIPGFSAVCYLLAYELQKTHDIPFGMIQSAWGGSGIKTWIGAGELKQTGNYDEELLWLQIYASDRALANVQFGQAWEEWWGQVYPTGGQPWNETAHESIGWTSSPARMGNWKEFGHPALANHHGLVWFRKSFDLSSAQAGQRAVLALGGIDEVDYLWVNGRFIGSTFGYGTERFYDLPPGTLKAGSNSITVNVLNSWGAGGMVGPNEQVALRFSDKQSIPLGYGWSYRKVPAEIASPPRAPWEELGGLTGLSNAMIRPLEGLKLAGAIWYQGESDTGNTAPYEQLLTALAADWRGRFGASLPVLIVELPNFGKLQSAPVESGWAELRDAQRRAAQAHPRTGLVVTIDTGDITDLHPPDKRVLGRRAADVARMLVYGEKGIPDGLSPTSAYRQGDEVVVEFDQATDRLFVVSAAAPAAFELCGSDAGTCVYAGSRLEGNRVVLTAPGLKEATRVRHCWADAPICNLYGASGLPVSSFEIQVAPLAR